jgi:hypothetical protein
MRGAAGMFGGAGTGLTGEGTDTGDEAPAPFGRAAAVSLPVRGGRRRAELIAKSSEEAVHIPAAAIGPIPVRGGSGFHGYVSYVK